MKLGDFFFGFCLAKESFHPEHNGNTKRLDFNEQERSSEFWHDVNRKALDQALKKERIETKAKNVILFIGDGMGYPTQTAGRILIGGEEYM